MRKASEGYTIVEVMIVLAVSATLFIAAVLIFGGRQGSEEFRQTMQDLSSTIQGYVNQVSSGIFPDSQSYSCSVAGRHAILTQSGSNGVGSREDCIFLGDAIRATADENSIRAYTVLGDRTNPVSGEPGSSLDATSTAFVFPEPAIDSADPAKLILTADYKLLFGAKIHSSKISDDPAGSHELIGFYVSLDSGVPTTGTAAASLDMHGYNLSGLNSDDQVKNCIEQNAAPCGSSLQGVTEWDLCVQNTGTGPPYARLAVTNSGGAINTRIDYLNSVCS